MSSMKDIIRWPTWQAEMAVVEQVMAEVYVVVVAMVLETQAIVMALEAVTLVETTSVTTTMALVLMGVGVLVEIETPEHRAKFASRKDTRLQIAGIGTMRALCLMRGTWQLQCRHMQ